MKARLGKIHVAALVAATCFAVFAFPASAQAPPSVSVRPADTTSDDPNGGQWFFTKLGPGVTGRLRARVFNPADVSQVVKFYIRDMDFGPDGTALINDGEQGGVGAWGRVEQPEQTIAAKTFVIVDFEITPPSGVDPGDHLGVFVAETAAIGGRLGIVQRVATRIYVTLPGDAARAFEIEERKWDHGGLWPRQATVTAHLRNTGRIRLEPAVMVNGVPAKGPKVLLSRSSEQYIATVPVAWYGGPVRVEIEAEDESGLVRRASASTFVIPWGLILLIAFSVSAAAFAYRFWRVRRSRFAKLQADVKRLEALLVAQRLPRPEIEHPRKLLEAAEIEPAAKGPRVVAMPPEKTAAVSRPGRAFKAKGSKRATAKKKPSKPKATPSRR